MIGPIKSIGATPAVAKTPADGVMMAGYTVGTRGTKLNDPVTGVFDTGDIAVPATPVNAKAPVTGVLVNGITAAAPATAMAPVPG
jgi:hypothetical protein